MLAGQIYQFRPYIKKSMHKYILKSFEYFSRVPNQLKSGLDCTRMSCIFCISNAPVWGMVQYKYLNKSSCGNVYASLFSKVLACRPYRHGTFRQESFRHGFFITGTFRHVHRSALRTFRQTTFHHGNVSTWGLFGTRDFRHGDFSAPEHFGTGIFRHLGHSDTCTSRHRVFSARGLFGTGTFRHLLISARGLFGTCTFRHRDFSARGLFGTCTFRHGDISARGFSAPGIFLARIFEHSEIVHTIFWPCWHR